MHFDSRYVRFTHKTDGFVIYYNFCRFFHPSQNGQWPPTSKERITVGLGCNVGQCNWPLQCGMGDAVCRLNEPESHILSCYIDLLLMQC